MKASLKNTFLTALALTMAIPVTLSTTTDSDARSRRGDAFIGGVVGGIVGGAIGSAHSRRYREPEVIYVEPRRPRRVYRRGGGNAHINWCYRKYRSYEARTDTYVSYGGRVRRCYSPYN